MTHDLFQAAHIADYYCTKEHRSDMWAVVEFVVDDKLLSGIRRKDVEPDKAKAYYDAMKERGNQVESDHDWTMAPIKDNKTNYVQHLFAKGGLLVLNHGSTKKKLVLQGRVGVDKDQYSAVRGYNMDEDPTLDKLLARDPDANVSSSKAPAVAGSSGSKKRVRPINNEQQLTDAAINLINNNGSEPELNEAKRLVAAAQQLGKGALEKLASIFDYADVSDNYRQQIGGVRSWREWLNHPRPATQKP